ncbi:MAG: ABC transporter permease subunit [Alphaproteobacteria bacterium]
MPADAAVARPRVGFVARNGRSLAIGVGLPLAILALVAGAMEAAKRLDWLPVTVPSPSEIAGAFDASADDLFFHMTPTVLSALAGYGIALALALLLAGLATSWRRARKPVLTFGVVVDSIPLIALTPILMVWLGNGVGSRIVIAAIASLFPLLVGAVQGLSAVDRNRSELFHVLSASRWQRLRMLALPSALPYLFAAMKIAAPLAVLGALIAEWVNAEQGLGIMMVYALFSFDVPLVWLTIVAVCALAMIGYGLVALVERLVVTWDTGGRIGAAGPA